MLNLSEDLFLGKGTHKKCYLHPEDSSKCIKMAYTYEGDDDLQRELRYLKVLRRKGKDYSVLPTYYGMVKTNLGEGHVYERIVNFDGSACKTLEDFLNDEKFLEKNFELVVNNLCLLKNNLLNNEIITMGIFPENILVQEGGTRGVSLRVINDMGSAALIPLEYYFGFVAKIRIQKRWRRFCKYIMDTYQAKIIHDLAQAIL